MQDNDWGLIQFGTAEEARGDYAHDIQRQQELDEMKTYEVQWVRVEHQVTLIEVQAKNEEDAAKKAQEIARSSGFEDYEYDVVYADEFANDVEEVK